MSKMEGAEVPVSVVTCPMHSNTPRTNFCTISHINTDADRVPACTSTSRFMGSGAAIGTKNIWLKQVSSCSNDVTSAGMLSGRDNDGCVMAGVVANAKWSQVVQSGAVHQNQFISGE